MPELGHRQILTVLAGLMLGMFVAALSQTVVATALPTIVGELGGQEQLSWVVSAALLAATASTPLWGKLSDLYGRKIMFQSAIGVFLVASLACGFAQTMGQLVGFRAAQGIGMGGLMALSQAIIGDVVSPRERGRYQGYMGAVFGISTVLGPLLGGVLVEQLSWRWTFWVGIPVGLLALAVTQRVLKLPFPRRSHAIDWLGALFIVASVSSLLLVLSLGGIEFAWNSGWTYGLLGAAVVLLAGAIWQERRHPEPIMAPRLFANRTFSLTSVAGFAVGVAMFGAIIFLPQYLQIVKGESPTASGLLMLPLMAGLMLTSIGSGKIITRTGRYKIFPVVGLLVTAIGLALLSWLTVDTPLVQVGLFMLVLGLGIGMVMQVLVLATQNAVEHRDLGAATAGSTFFRSLGGALGVAVFGALFNNRLQETVPARLAEAGVPADRLGTGMPSLGSPEQLARLPETIHTAVITGFADALQPTFLAAIPFALLGFLVVLFLPEIPLRGRMKTEPEAALAPAPPASTAPGDALADGHGAAPNPAASDAAPSAAVRGNGHMMRPSTGHRTARHPSDGQPPAPATVFTGSATSHPGQHQGKTGPALTGCADGDDEQATASGPGGSEDVPAEPVIFGQVRQGRGVPLAGAAMTLTDLFGQQLDRQASGLGGRYRLRPPSDGGFLVICAHPEHRPAVAVVAVAGGPTRHDVTLPGTGARLSGTVRAAGSEQHLAAAMVMLLDVHGEVVATTTTGQTGDFAFINLAEGAYTLTVAARNSQPVAHSLDVPGEGHVHHDVELVGRVRLVGSIVSGNLGVPVPEALTTLIDADGSVVHAVISGGDGRFAFDDLPPGRYTVTASGYPPTTAAVNLDGEELTQTVLALRPPTLPGQTTGSTGRKGPESGEEHEGRCNSLKETDTCD